MKLARRKVLRLAACAAALPIVPPVAWAQAYPARAVRIVVPVAAGGANDVTGRLIAQWLSERLGQQFVIENRPGAGTNIGTEAVLRGPADGYTLLIAGSNAAINATLFDQLPFNFIHQFRPFPDVLADGCSFQPLTGCQHPIRAAIAAASLYRMGKAGDSRGIYSVCSAHPLVIEAAMRRALRQSGSVLIEATSNQVNQDGGYTGMRPADFARFVRDIAARVGLPAARVLLGGDHLGPNCWQHLDAEEALQRSEQLLADYVTAGFRKRGGAHFRELSRPSQYRFFTPRLLTILRSRNTPADFLRCASNMNARRLPSARVFCGRSSEIPLFCSWHAYQTSSRFWQMRTTTSSLCQTGKRFSTYLLAKCTSSPSM